VRLPDLQPLVSATGAEHNTITGEGIMDGNGESWWQEARTPSRRPRPLAQVLKKEYWFGIAR
jgi:hypothetical protein